MKVAKGLRAAAIGVGGYCFCVAVACSSTGGDTAGGGVKPSEGVAAIHTVSPTKVFRGRATELSIGGVNTSFSDASKVSIAGEKIAVSKVHAISSAGLRAVATVPADFPDTMANVVVDGLTAVGAIEIDDAVKAPDPIKLDPGASAELVLVNFDLAHPFGNVTLVEGGANFVAEPTGGSESQQRVVVTALPGATAGPHDLLVSMDSGKQVSAIVKGAVVVSDKAIVPFTPKMDQKLTVPKGKDRAVLKIAGIAGKLFNARVVPDGMTMAPKSALALLDPAVGFKSPLAFSFAGEVLAAPKAPDTALLYVILLGAPFDSDQTVVLNGDLVAPASAAEVEPNEDAMTASPISAPALVTATLGKKADVDVYSLMVPAGTLVVRTLADDTVMSKYATDTKIEILDASQKLIGSNDDEDPNSTYSFATATVATGTVLIRIRSGTNAFTDGGAYKLAALVR